MVASVCQRYIDGPFVRDLIELYSTDCNGKVGGGLTLLRRGEVGVGWWRRRRRRRATDFVMVSARFHLRVYRAYENHLPSLDGSRKERGRRRGDGCMEERRKRARRGGGGGGVMPQFICGLMNE